MAELPHEMIFAARDGDVATLRRMLKDGQAVNAANEMGQTCLHFASMWGHVAAVAALG